MNNSYYNSALQSNKNDIATYVKNISDSLDIINSISIKNDWKCDDNNDVISELEYLQGLSNTIKNSLNSHVDFLTTVGNTYTGIEDEIKTALRIEDNS